MDISWMSYKRSSRVIFIFIPSLFFRSVVSKECAVCTLHTTTITATAIISQFYAVLGNNLFYYYKYKYFSIRWCVSVRSVYLWRLSGLLGALRHTWTSTHWPVCGANVYWKRRKTKPPNGVSNARKVELESYARFEWKKFGDFGSLRCWIGLRHIYVWCAATRYRSIPGQAFQINFYVLLLRQCAIVHPCRIHVVGYFGMHDWTPYFANFDDIELHGVLLARNHSSELQFCNDWCRYSYYSRHSMKKNEIHQNDSCVYICIQMDQSAHLATGEYETITRKWEMRIAWEA